MKKYLVLLFIFLLVGCSFSENKQNNKKNEVNLYLFYSSTCPHCHNEINWLNEIEKKYSYLKITKIEISKNHEYYQKVLEKLNIEDMYVPLTIIGSDYTFGFSDDIKEEIESYIERYSDFKSCDAVKMVIENGNVDSCNDKNNKNLK